MSGGGDPGIRTAALCRALGHPARVAILRFLRSRPGGATCGEIVSQLPLAQSTISAHLRVLTRAGLLTAVAQRPRVRYRVDADGTEVLKQAIAAL
jgi:ArsR family transcriptional regulator